MKKEFLPFLKIDHKTNFELTDEQFQKNETLNLFTTLSLVSDDNIGKEINKFFDIILPENSLKDVFKINIAISEKIKNGKNKKLVVKTLNSILNKKEDVTLNLTSNELYDLSIIISVIYNKLSKSKIVNNYETFLNEIKKFKKSNFDVLKRYINEKVINNFHLSTSISPPSSTNNSMNEDLSRTNLSSSPKKIRTIKHLNLINQNNLNYKFQEFKDDKYYIIPIECMILIKKFEKVKKIKLKIENDIDEEIIRNNIFILLNNEWLFQNLMEIEIDLSNEEIYKDYYNLYNEELINLGNSSKKLIKNTNYSGYYNNKRIFDPIHELNFKEEEDENNNSDSFEDIFSLTIDEEPFLNIVNDKKYNLTYDEFLKKYDKTFQLIIIYSFFISKIKNLYNANIIIPDEMEKDILNYLNKNNVILMNFQFLNFFTFNSNLIGFTYDFNSLDSNSFEKLIGFIYKNENLKSLRLSFFPPEEYFSPQMLLKLLFTLNYNFKSIFPKIENFSNFEGGVHTEIDSLILNKLINSFENNLSKFFLLLTKKNEIKELSLLFDIPSVLRNSEDYLLILLKFFINLFVLLEKNFNNYETLIIQAEYSFIDNRKNPFLNHCLSKRNLFQNKLTKLKKLTFHSNFFNITQIYNIISPNLNYLSIGYLDKDTFENLILYITSSEFSSNSNLLTLQISLNNTINNYNLISDLFYLFFSEYPKSLKEIIIISSIEINFYELTQLIKLNNYNTLEKILLQFSKRSLKDREDFFSENKSNKSNSFIIEKESFQSFYIVRNKKKTNLLLFLMDSLSKKFNKNFMSYNIFHGIEKFIFKKKDKEVFIKYK